MPTIPTGMLKQLYRRGSLRNVAGGWEFTMRNSLASATLVGIGVACNGVELDTGTVRVVQPEAGMERSAAEISAEEPLRFPVGVDTVIRVAGPSLPRGTHTLAVRADTREIGTVTIPVQDTLAE
ncbi:MAG: hypothetical protein ACR2M0_16325 [Chloroflexia bacterium]